MISNNVNIYENVEIGEGSVLEAGVIIGMESGKNTRKTIIGKNAYIRTNTIICAGVVIGDNFQTGPGVFIREDNNIGNDVCVWAYTVLNPGNTIGDGSRIHVNCFLEEVVLGKLVFVGPNVTFTDDSHPTNPPKRTCMKGALVEDQVVIGGNVTVLPHIKIGERALVGAGSVVTTDVKAGKVVVGNPARVIKNVEDISCNRSSVMHYPYKKGDKYAKKH